LGGASAQPPVAQGLPRTVMEASSPNVRTVPLMRPEPGHVPAPAAIPIAAPAVPAALAVPLAGPAIPPSAKRSWNARYAFAVAIAAAAVVLLAVLTFTRKPAVQPLAATTGSGSATDSGLPQPAQYTTSPPPSAAESLLDPASANSGSPSSSPSSRPAPRVPLVPAGQTRTPNRTATNAGNAAPVVPRPASERPQPQATSPPSAAQTDELEHQFNQLVARAASVDESLNRMRRQQAALGVGLRGDIVSRHASMQGNLSSAQRAIASGDATRAEKYVTLAAADLDALEQFLGR